MSRWPPWANIRNKATCKGDVMSTANGMVLTGMVEEVEYQVSVRLVQIRSIGEDEEAGAHHLPCQFKLGSCMAGNFKTYMWYAT